MIGEKLSSHIPNSLRQRIGPFDFRPVVQFGPDHVFDGFMEVPFTGPLQFYFRPASVTAQSVGHLPGGAGWFSHFDKFVIIKPGGPKGAFHQFANPVTPARSKNIIAWSPGLKGEPEAADKIAGIAPVTFCVQAGERQFIHTSLTNGRHGTSHATAEVILRTKGRLVVVEDAG